MSSEGCVAAMAIQACLLHTAGKSLSVPRLQGFSAAHEDRGQPPTLGPDVGTPALHLQQHQRDGGASLPAQEEASSRAGVL